MVTEAIAESGLSLLRQAGHEVDVHLEPSPDELLDLVEEAEALIVRSATRVTAEVIEKARRLVVIGRAGIGLDNIDVEAATRRGIIVANAPHSNTLSAAEHTMALLLAQARNVPQAHAALVSGRWERSRWKGVELSGKTLGIIGLGRIGRLVAQRALAFGMKLIAYDPYVSEERARQLSVTLVDLEELMERSDFVTIHVARTPQTEGMIGRDLLARAKPGMRLVNVARGGIVDEEALAEAIREGRLAGAAIDVFADEPCTSSPLFELESVVVTPHLGASTVEAQDKAGIAIAEQVNLALAGEFVPFAVNLGAVEVNETVRPFVALAERLGEFLACLTGEGVEQLEVECQGQLADYDTRALTLAVLKGYFSRTADEPVSYVNAPRIAEERGVVVRDSHTTTTHDWVNLLSVRGGTHMVAGTMHGLKAEPRIVKVDDHLVDIPPERHMLVVRNEDRPGVIGFVGTVLGDAGVNISNMDVGKSPEGEAALMVLATDQPVPSEVIKKLQDSPLVRSVHAVTLG